MKFNFEKKKNTQEIKKGPERTFVKKMKRFSKRLFFTTSVIAGIGMAREYCKQNELQARDVIETSIVSNEKIFTHSDKKTTDYLNYITKKDVSKEIVRQREADLERYLDPKISHLSDSLVMQDAYERMAEEAPYYFKTLQSKNITNGDEYVDMICEERRKEFKEEFNQKYYEAIWALESANGRPRIRSAHDDKPDYFFTEKGRDQYIPETNTMYINMVAPENTFLAELSHAQQFNTDYWLRIKNELIFLKNLGETGIHALSSDESLNESYEHTYDDHGSVEHEAHEIIENELKAELAELMKKQTMLAKK